MAERSSKGSWRSVAWATPAIGLLVSSCEGLGPVADPLATAACPELRGGAMSGIFTGNVKTNGAIRAFVQASADLRDVSMAMEAQVAAACARMGAELGVPPQAMQARSSAGGRAQGACEPVLARIDGILRAAGNAQLAVSYTPPECRFAADAYASCAAQCNVALDPGTIVARCDPARLSGYCQGTCSGACDGVCNGECAGAARREMRRGSARGAATGRAAASAPRRATRSAWGSGRRRGARWTGARRALTQSATRAARHMRRSPRSVRRPA